MWVCSGVSGQDTLQWHFFPSFGHPLSFWLSLSLISFLCLSIYLSTSLSVCLFISYLLIYLSLNLSSILLSFLFPSLSPPSPPTLHPSLPLSLPILLHSFPTSASQFLPTLPLSTTSLPPSPSLLLYFLLCFSSLTQLRVEMTTWEGRRRTSSLFSRASLNEFHSPFTTSAGMLTII